LPFGCPGFGVGLAVKRSAVVVEDGPDGGDQAGVLARSRRLSLSFILALLLFMARLSI